MGVMKMGLEGLIGVDLPIPTRWYGKTTEKNPRLVRGSNPGPSECKAKSQRARPPDSVNKFC
jgi:hypothetical protein